MVAHQLAPKQGKQDLALKRQTRGNVALLAISPALGPSRTSCREWTHHGWRIEGRLDIPEAASVARNGSISGRPLATRSAREFMRMLLPESRDPSKNLFGHRRGDGSCPQPGRLLSGDHRFNPDWLALLMNNAAFDVGNDRRGCVRSVSRRRLDAGVAAGEARNEAPARVVESSRTQRTDTDTE